MECLGESPCIGKWVNLHVSAFGATNRSASGKQGAIEAKKKHKQKKEKKNDIVQHLD